MTIRTWSGVSYTATGKKLKQIIDYFPGDHDDYYVTSSYRSHTPSSHHGGRLYYGGSRTAAVDIGFNYGSSGYQTRAREFARWLNQFTGDTVELIHSPGFYTKNTRKVAPYAVDAHYDHIHFACSSAQADRILARLRKTAPSESEKPKEFLDMADKIYYKSDKMQALNLRADNTVTFNRTNRKNSEPAVSVAFGNKKVMGNCQLDVRGTPGDGFGVRFVKVETRSGKPTIVKHKHPDHQFYIAPNGKAIVEFTYFDYTNKDERLRVMIYPITDNKMHISTASVDLYEASR